MVLGVVRRLLYFKYLFDIENCFYSKEIEMLLQSEY
jgi:hypothetical protein